MLAPRRKAPPARTPRGPTGRALRCRERGSEASLPPAHQDACTLAPHSNHRRQYRVVPAPLYLTHFASDRSHMLVKQDRPDTASEGMHGGSGGDLQQSVCAEDGGGNTEVGGLPPSPPPQQQQQEQPPPSRWMAPPPPWPLLRGSGSKTMNLPAYWAMHPRACCDVGELARMLHRSVQAAGQSAGQLDSGGGADGGGDEGGAYGILGLVVRESDFLGQVLGLNNAAAAAVT